jgi:hypothetical protein
MKISILTLGVRSDNQKYELRGKPRQDFAPWSRESDPQRLK